MQVVDLKALLKTGNEGDFLDVARFNEHTFGTSCISGTSPYWEMHPDTDEFFYVMEGAFEVELLLDTGSEHVKIPAGSVGVVPKGIWHKPGAEAGTSFLYLTPGRTLHSDKADPRTEETGD